MMRKVSNFLDCIWTAMKEKKAPEMCQNIEFSDDCCLSTTKEAGRKEEPDAISYSYLHINSGIRIHFFKHVTF